MRPQSHRDDASCIKGLWRDGPTRIQPLLPDTQIDPDNSWGLDATQTLSAAATLTGAATLNRYPELMISAKVVGGTATLYVDFSVDGGSNYDTSIPYAMADGVGEFHTIIKGVRTHRIRVVAGSADLTEVRVHTECGLYRQANKSLQVALGRDDDAAVVRPSDFYQEVQEGRRSGYSMETKFGANNSVDTTGEDIWGGGGIYTGHPVSFTPETVDAFSSDDEDGGAGTDTGALTIRITGLKTSTSTAYESEDITLNGTTAVTSASTWWRVNRAFVLTAGSTGANIGTITIRSTTTTANVFAVMPIGSNQTRICAWTVPAGNTAWLKRIRISIARANGATGSAQVSIRVREPGGVYRSRRAYDITTAAPVQYTALGGLEIVAGSDIKVRVDNASNAGTEAEATLEMLVVED